MPSDYGAIRTEHRRRYGEDVGNYGGLHLDRLEVRHDGRDFTEADVRGICGIKRGTKADDPDQIGRFGVGFKSVYAYTSRPTVHCGDEHFQVRDYVHPYPADPVDPGAG